MAYDTVAINDLRSYIWSELVASNLIDPNDYRIDGMAHPLIPIIPSQQVPEFVNMLRGKAFIVYEYKVYPTQVQWWMTEERAIFYVYTPNFDLSNKLVNFFHDLFRRFDESAVAVNAYLGNNTDFKFHHISIGTLESALPTKAEGDFQEALIEIEYTYSRITGADGRF